MDDYLKRHEYLSFDKTLKTTAPKLTIKKEHTFEYLSPDGKTCSCQFNPSTSEYKILQYLIDNYPTPAETTKLILLLNKPRRDADSADPKQRVRDKIKAITKKLGNGVITKSIDGYAISCEIAKV